MNEKVSRATEAVKAAEERMQAALDSLENAPEDIVEEDLSALNDEFDAAEAEFKSAEAAFEREERIAQAREAHPVPKPEPKQITITEEPADYRADVPNVSWLRDLLNARTGDAEAINRLQRNNKHVRETMRSRGEQRANATGTGFLPPIYLGDEWAGIPHPARPLANALPKFNLPPDGMTFTIPVVSGATSVATHQDGGNVSDTAATTTTVSHTLVAIAGQNEIDRVVLERSFPGLDMVIFDDLRRLYDTLLDQQLFTGSGSSGQHLGLDNVGSILTVTYTNASPTPKDALQNAIYAAFSKVYENRYLPPSCIVMHPRRAAWFAAGFDTSFPIFHQGGMGTFQVAGQDAGVAGMIAGLPVIVDANVPTTKGASTNQDTIYVLRIEDLLFGEEPAQSAVFEEVVSSTLAIRLQLWGYSLAALDRYPTAICAINGTGLAAPAGY
jgi:HK97 family phage major capsid protein